MRNFKRGTFLFITALFTVSCAEDAYMSDTDLLDWVGSWTCNETSGDFAPQTYAIEIVERVGENSIAIKGLYNQGLNFSVNGVIQGRSLDIPQQLVDGIMISGSGNMDEDYEEISLFFTADDGSGNDVVEALIVR